MGSETSQWSVDRRGCPQGSTFGPLLWNVFQNNLAEVVIRTDLSMYADNHQTFSSDNSFAWVEERLLHNGNKMTSWYEEENRQYIFRKLDFTLPRFNTVK